MRKIKSYITLFCIAFFMLMLQNQFIYSQVPAPAKFYTKSFHWNNTGNVMYCGESYNTKNSFGQNAGAEGVHNNENNQHWLVMPTYPTSSEYFIVNCYNGGILDIDVAHNNNVYVYTSGLPHCKSNQTFRLSQIDGLCRIGTPHNPDWVIGRSTSGESKDPWDYPNRRANNLYIQGGYPTGGEAYIFNEVGTIPNSGKISVYDNNSFPPMPTLGSQVEDYDIIGPTTKMDRKLVAQTVIPYPLVIDSGLTQAQKVANSPYYILKKYRYYEVSRIVFLHGNYGYTESKELIYEHTVTKSTEVEKTLTTKFSASQEVSVGADVDFLKLGQKIVANFEQTLSLRSKDTYIDSEQQTAKFSSMLSKSSTENVNAAFYTLFESYELYRLNETTPFREWVCPVAGSLYSRGTEPFEPNGIMFKSADNVYHYERKFNYFTFNASTDDAVPIMTSNTSPSGIASSSTILGTGYEAWRAFDGNAVPLSRWISNNGDLKPILSYEFAKPECISAYYLAPETGGAGNRAPKSWKLQGWDTDCWYTIDKQENIRVGIEWNPAGNTFPIKHQRYYKKYRLLIEESNGAPVISIKQFKLLYPQTIIPTMTSNTAPSGIVTASGRNSTTYDFWNAFDGKNNLLTTRWISEDRTSGTGWWLAYDFATATSISGYFIYPEVYGGRAPLSWNLQGWNGSGWVNIDQQSAMTTAEWGKTYGKIYKLATVVSYPKYRLLFNASNGAPVISIYSFELYQNTTSTSGSMITQEGIATKSNGVQNEDVATKLSLYPNPNNGSFSIDVVGEANSGIPITILDNNGKVVYSSLLNEGQFEINTKLPAGVYILKSEINGDLNCQKFIIQ